MASGTVVVVVGCSTVSGESNGPRAGTLTAYGTCLQREAFRGVFVIAG